MAGWYMVTEGDETVHVRALNTRVALAKGFRLTCGSRYILPPGGQMKFSITRLSGRSDIAKLLEKTHQAMRIKKKEGK
jgi:hypothetical protein